MKLFNSLTILACVITSIFVFDTQRKINRNNIKIDEFKKSVIMFNDKVEKLDTLSKSLLTDVLRLERKVDTLNQNMKLIH